jgi:hypothetical protein
MREESEGKSDDESPNTCEMSTNKAKRIVVKKEKEE